METEHEGAQGLVLWRQPGHEHLPGQLMPICGQSQWPAERRMGECQELLDEDEAAAGRRRTGMLGWMATIFHGLDSPHLMGWIAPISWAA